MFGFLRDQTSPLAKLIDSIPIYILLQRVPIVESGVKITMNYNAYPSWYTEALETSEGTIVPVHTPDPTAAGVTYRSSPASTARKLAYDDIVVSSTKKISDDANKQMKEVKVHPPSPPASSERHGGKSGAKGHAVVDDHMSTKVMRAHAHREKKNSQSKTIICNAGNDDPRESARRGTYFGLCKF